MACNEEGHHLVDEVFVGETAGFEGDGDDVDAGCFLLLHCLALAFDEVPASLLDVRLCFQNFLVLQ